MKAFRYVIYAVIDLQLDGILHIGNGDDDSIGLAVNSQGQYIIPATGFAGPVRHGIGEKSDANDSNNKYDKYFGSSEGDDSRIYFYDAVCEDTYVEKRTGVKIDSRLGTAEDKYLYNTYYLGDGMTTSIRLQAFAADQKEKKALIGISGDDAARCPASESANKAMDKSSQDSADESVGVIGEIIGEIASGRITFGAKTGIGAGRFKITGVRTRVLDLTNIEDRNSYLGGVKAMFDSCAPDQKLNKIAQEKEEEIPDFRLTAIIPDGLLVKSGDLSDIANDVNMNRAKHGRSGDEAKNADGGVGNSDINIEENESEYFIPGSTMKGLFRSYAETICHAKGLSDEKTDALVIALFGNKNEKKDSKAGDAADKVDEEKVSAVKNEPPRRAGKLRFSDVVIHKPCKVIHPRIKIDRWLGGTFETAKMSEELLSTKGEDSFDIDVSVNVQDDPYLMSAANAFIFLTCRDLARGLIPIGSGSSEGLGRLQGKKLFAKGGKYTFDGDGRVKMTDGSESANSFSEIQSWLGTLNKLCCDNYGDDTQNKFCGENTVDNQSDTVVAQTEKWWEELIEHSLRGDKRKKAGKGMRLGNQKKQADPKGSRKGA